MNDDEYRRMRKAEDDAYEYHGDACVNKIRIISIRRFERVVENDRQ